jgi:hypothetical protein
MLILNLYLVHLHSSQHRTFLNIALCYSYNKRQRVAPFLKIIFVKELYMFRTSLPFIIRSLNTVYTAVGILHVGYVDCQTACQNYIELLLALTYQTTPQKEKIVPKPLLLNRRRQKLYIYTSSTNTKNEEFRKWNIWKYIGISLNFIKNYSYINSMQYNSSWAANSRLAIQQKCHICKSKVLCNISQIADFEVRD